MSKVFRPNNKESLILSKIESSIERERRLSIKTVKTKSDEIANKIAMKLVENDLVETTSKNSLQEQIKIKCEELSKLDDFDIDYQCAPFRKLVNNPNIVGLFITAFVIETLINHPDTIDIYGSDEEIYRCITGEILKYIP
ncbi:MAG: hypothetical protein GY714_22540 [Desulfobacterales bacterium]|nr:hypothetical protein [Desulfobacterales bacterium]